MKISLKIEFYKIPPENWDENIESSTCEGLRLMHTSGWADRIVFLKIGTPFYVRILEGAQVVGQLLIFERMKPAGNWALKKLFDAKSIFWYAPPAMLSATREFPWSLFSSHPLVKHAEISESPWFSTKSAEEVQSRTWATVIVDLKPEIVEIEKTLKNSARKEIRNAKTAGIVVKKIDTLEELEVYYAFASECARRYNKPMEGFHDFSSMWNFLRRTGIFETFVAFHESEMIAGLSVWGDGKRIQELGSFQSAESYKKKLAGPDLIKWEIIKWAKGVGIEEFDLAGVNPNPQTPKEEGIRQFKMKWSTHLLPIHYVSRPRPLSPIHAALKACKKLVTGKHNSVISVR